MRKFKAVLFDFDGVIADTMPDNFVAWQKAFKDVGVEIKENDYYPLEGYSTLDIAKILLKKYKKTENPKTISDSKHHYYLKFNTFRLYKEIKNIIDFLFKKNIELALVSGAKRSRIEWSLKNLKKEFKAIVAGDDIKKGKPAPDPYLLAAEKIGHPSYSCIVVENAPIGIQSAKAAGCFCIALTTTMKNKELKKADVILNSHTNLLKYFKRIFK